ncbi:AAA-type ATPase family protein [Actinidia rufa]|uniref:AAA-type ATPase family protein n=1 Tax=Actinidia rufa TaxID=165716 RepID=A0A7J0GPE7_9ERIC|nr:AAA-type ATPase family protein [Actinidia rufa]
MGESEKLVSNLFQMARDSEPSIIFIDEIDSLCGQRGEGNESEASRRIKTELLVQMQGVGHGDEKVLVLAATNTPYALDQAIRRRFDKRIYIPLPDVKARQHMFKVHLGDTPHNLTESDFESLARKTEGFSGSDISVCVKDVLFEPVRKTQDAMFFVKTPNDLWMPCGPKQPGAIQTTMQDLAAKGLASQIIPPPISKIDFDKVIARQRPTVSKSDLEVHDRFTKEFGEEAGFRDVTVYLKPIRLRRQYNFGFSSVLRGKPVSKSVLGLRNKGAKAIAEKPSWIRHEGMQVLSIDIQPGGLRFATGGGDHKVRIWNMKSVGRNLETNESTPKVHATLRDHFGLLTVLGTTEFGSGEPPDRELESCHDIERTHYRCGVTWDPVGSLIASQSDDKTVIIWRTSNWSLVHRTDGHWTNSLRSTFFRRLGWSPCGHFITTRFKKPRHFAPVLEGGEWSATFDFLGHNARHCGDLMDTRCFIFSLDGAVATFHFEEKDLGQRLTDAVLDELKTIRYGDISVMLTDGGIRECSDMKEQSGVTARATISDSLVIEKVAASAGGDGSISVGQTGSAKAFVSLASSGNLSIRVFDKKEGEDTMPVCLEARPREPAASDIVGVEVTVLAGNANFWAVGVKMDACRLAWSS